MTPSNTYSRGTKRLDYIFISHHLLGTIRKLGYLAIHDGIISDHRMCYIDVNMITFLGGYVNQTLKLYQRVFKCDDKARSALFVKELKDHMRKNKIQERINEVKEEFKKEGKTEVLIQSYNGIYYKFQCAVKGAVKKVGRTNFGYHRSPALTKAGKMVLIWRAIWSC